MSSKKKILTGHVARVIDGTLVALGPGDPAPDWVTNPALFENADEDDGGTPTSPPTPASTPAPKTETKSTDTPKDDLSELGIEDLRKLAEAAGVAKSGKKAEIAARIRAKREADAADAGDSGSSDETGDRAALIEKAAALGIDDADSLTDDELAAAIEAGE